MIESNPGCWHLITGEYPPGEGGIGDYSSLVAGGLTMAGAEVHIWTNGVGETVNEENGVTVHRDGFGWSGRDLTRLGRALDGFPAPRRLLIQYAPNVWGRKGMNLGFCRWLVGRKRRGNRIDLMFHEVCSLPGSYNDRPPRGFLPWVQRAMARRVMAASERVFIPTTRWAELLRPLDPIPNRRPTWLPVPSNIKVVEDPSGVIEIRRRFNGPILGRFGTFANASGATLAEVFPRLLEGNQSWVALMIGLNSDLFARRLCEEHPELSGRVYATGSLAPEDVSRHLQACDLLVQPYPGGVCGRRGSFMAVLAHGVAAITTEGPLTDRFWRASRAVALAPEGKPEVLAKLASTLLDFPELRTGLAAAGRELYREFLSIDRTVEKFLAGLTVEAEDRCRLGRD